VDTTELSHYDAIFNCIKMTIPFMYLGIPIGGNSRKRKMWKSMILKIEKKLARWKAKKLSFAGRVTMIKSIIIVFPPSFF